MLIAGLCWRTEEKFFRRFHASLLACAAQVQILTTVIVEKEASQAQTYAFRYCRYTFKKGAICIQKKKIHAVSFPSQKNTFASTVLEHNAIHT